MERLLHLSRAISACTQERANGCLMLFLGSEGCSPGTIPAEHAWIAKSSHREWMMRNLNYLSQGTVASGPKCPTNIVGNAANVANKRPS